MVEIFKLAVQPDMTLAFAVALAVRFLVFVLRFRGRKAGVNVLRDGLLPTPPTRLDA
jgi:hypothetical protein